MNILELVPRDWVVFVEFTDGGPFLNLTGLAADAALDCVRAEIRKGRLLKNTYHVVRRGDRPVVVTRAV